jgi:catalase
MNMAKKTHKKSEHFTDATGAPVPDNTNILTAGRRAAHGTFTTTHDITKYTKAAFSSKIGRRHHVTQFCKS